MHMDFSLLVLAYCSFFRAPSFLIAKLALRCFFNHVNCPSVICSPCIVALSYFGRETSLVNFMGPRSVFPPLFTPSLYFLFYFLVAVIITFYLLCLTLCKQQGRRD